MSALRKGPATRPERLSLRLYVEGAAAAERGEATALRQHFESEGFDVDFEIIDVTEERPPDVLATPLLMRVAPRPERRLVGEFSQTERIAEILTRPEDET